MLIKSNGNPLILQQMIANIMEEKQIQSRSKNQTCGVIQDDLLKVLQNEQFNCYRVPFISLLFIRKTFSRLDPEERLFLKIASVIGNEFDLQAFLKLYNLDGERMTKDQILKVFHNLDKMEIIEVMDISPSNVIYKFSYYFMREFVYKSLTKKQRSVLHQEYSQCLQLMNSPLICDELSEQMVLEFHLENSSTVNQSLSTDQREA